MIATSTDWERQIKLLQLLSAEMLEFAEAGSWETVSEWENKRRILLNDLLAQSTPDEIAPLLKETVRVLLSIDSQLVDKARDEMGKLGDQLAAIHKGRRALDAYQSL